jgi:ESCRT-II complex subunit VPS25
MSWYQQRSALILLAAATVAASRNMDKAQEDYVFPAIYQFPPFYTLQPQPETREKQLRMWCDFVLSYCSHHKLSQVDTERLISVRSPLICNVALQRMLKPETVALIFGRLVEMKRAERLSHSTSVYFVYYYTPEEWADRIYRWASDHGFLDSVVTAYEIQHGDLSQDQEFFGLDSEMVMKALQVLEKRKKAQVFQGSSSEEHGVKFFR